MTLQEVLGDAGLSRLTALSHLHEDGWGMAWWEDSGLRSVSSHLPAHRADGFLPVAREVRTDAALFHLRWATPGLAVRPENTHPFIVGRWAFGHNGAVRPAAGLLPMLRADDVAQLQGDTDSERLLHLLLARVADHGLDEGLRRTVADVCEELTPSSLNALLLGRTELTAVCCHGAPSLGDAPVLDGPPEDQPGYFDLRWRHTSDAVIVASEPLDDGEWTPMRNGTALVVERSSVTVRTVDVGAFPPAALAREQSRRSGVLGAP
jgi:predicted glutamine amidotransferase